MPTTDALVKPAICTLVAKHRQQLDAAPFQAVVRLKDEKVILYSNWLVSRDNRCGSP